MDYNFIIYCRYACWGEKKAYSPTFYAVRILTSYSFFVVYTHRKGGPGASGRVLPPVTGRSQVRVAVSSHCTGEGKACH